MYGEWGSESPLIGKKIENVLLSKDRVVIVFVTVDGETFPYSAEGD